MTTGSTVHLMQPDGSMRCPRCGGTSFTPRHSTARKITFGVATLVGTPNQLQCDACGAKYDRMQRLTPPMPRGTVPARPDF